MSNSATPDEKSKIEVARKAITPKRLYFLPDYPGPGVEAEDVEKAVAAAERRSKRKKVEDGDGE